MNSLYDQAREGFTPELMDRLEGYFGATPVMLERAVRAAVSALSSGAIQKASTEDGATAMLSELHTPVAEAINSALTPQTSLQAAVQQGRPVAAFLLGNRLAGAADMVASASNVTPATAAGLLSLAAPFVLSALERIHTSDAGEFGALLSSERGQVLDAGPAAVTSLIEDGGFSWRHIVPMILLGSVLVCVPFLYKGCGEVPAPPASVARAAIPVVELPKPEKIDLPNGGAIIVLPGTINYDLSKFLASSDPVPKRFTFDHLNFEFNKTVITPESRPTLSDLVTILKSYPAVDVRLEGHTDSVGTAAENKKLSEDRANAIRFVLQSDGIAAKRIAMAGFGGERPIASNDTEEGRARNRRLELVVVKK
jgi:outer membrane protein OmpA-like peptidoglycan-associated protein